MSLRPRFSPALVCLLAAAGLAASGCNDPAPDPEGVPTTKERSPEGRTPADLERDRRRTAALGVEHTRLLALRGRIDRADAELATVAPRLKILRKASLESDSRPTAVHALAALDTDEYEEVGLFRGEAFETGWTVLVKTDFQGQAMRYADGLSAELELDGIRQASYPPAGKDAYRLGFALLTDQTVPTSRPPTRPRPTAGTPPPATDEALKTAIGQLRSEVSTAQLEAARRASDEARAELDGLESRHVTKGQAQRTARALVACAEKNVLDAVRAEPAQKVRHNDLSTERYDMRGVGRLSQIAAAVQCMVDTGTLIGVVSINRVRREGRYRLRVELHVVTR